MEVSLHVFLTQVLAENKWLASRCGRCIPEERAPLLKGRQDGKQIRSRGIGVEKKSSIFSVNEQSFLLRPVCSIILLII
jgi:hypothetical protein